MNECSFCGRKIPTISIEDLGEKIHEILDDYFYQTSPEPEGYEYTLAKEGLWKRSGQPIGELIQEIADIEEEIAEAVHDYLSSTYDAWGKDAQLEEQPYATEAQYAENDIDTFEYSESWDYFKNQIRTRSRYFNTDARKVLDKIFANVDKLVTKDNEPVIQEMPAGDPNQLLYRARVALSENELKEIILGLPDSLGAPPHEKAKSMRMNASGISVFYGALDIDTCITEVRAPVGSSVIVGEFYTLRPLKILNLNRLQKVYVTGSYFDPNHIIEISRAGFLEQLVEELSSPVLPGSEEREYLHTQFVAEYLDQLKELSLDGVIFKSTQASGDGENIVLFYHAKVLKPYELPEETELEVSFGTGPIDDYDSTIIVFEKVPPKKTKKPKRKKLSDSSPIFVQPDYNSNYDELLEEPLNPTLRLELEKVKVHKVRSVKYHCESVDVIRLKTEKRSHDEFK